MADLMMLVDTAVITPVNRMPLIDDGDFKTIEDAVAYNAGGMDLRWNFVTAAGVQTSTAVTPTTGGSYDWTHLGDGIYSMEIPASGGGSANNDTEGFGWWSGKATGVLPWAGPIIQFSPANVVNSFVVGSDLFDVSVTQWLGTAAATPTVAGVPEVDVTHWIGTAAATPTTAGVPEVDVTFIAGTAYASADLSATMKTSVNGEVLDVLNVDTFAEVGTETPAATQTIRKMISLLYKAWRNKSTQTTTTYILKNDDTTTTGQTATTSDDGTTFTRGEMS